MKKNLVKILYLLILFGGINFFRNQEERLKYPILEEVSTSEVVSQSSKNKDFKIKNIDENKDTKKIVCEVIVNTTEQNDFDYISSVVYNSIQKEYSFNSLELNLYNKNKLVYKISY